MKILRTGSTTNKAIHIVITQTTFQFRYIAMSNWFYEKAWSSGAFLLHPANYVASKKRFLCISPQLSKYLPDPHLNVCNRCIPDLQKYYVGARNESFAFINRLVQAPARTNPPDACISLRV